MSNHTKVELDKLQYKIHYSSKLGSMRCLAYLIFMLHNVTTRSPFRMKHTTRIVDNG